MPIEVNSVSYVYAKGTPFETSALRNVSLTVENGEFVGIMGHTGCGKSTLIQLIDGLMRPTEGKILLDGEDINSKGYDRYKLRRKLGIVFQYPEYQLFETTVERDVAFGLKHLGLSKAEVTDRARWALETVGFDFGKVRGLSPMGLSGGEKRRAAIAGVLAVKPEVLIFDEPVAGLDPLGRDALMELTYDLNAAGTTIIMVSHNADALAEYAGRIIVLENGELIEDGAARQILSDVRKLREKQLGISQPTLIAEMMRERGVDIGHDVIRYNELISRVVLLVNGGVQK
ncbi:MAG: energy-coupling factor transporter ATPase [Clostridiales bacterium]|nr:energy-coupling factor transporter ATPase [Clostridiales bacterium]